VGVRSRGVLAARAQVLQDDSFVDAFVAENKRRMRHAYGLLSGGSSKWPPPLQLMATAADCLKLFLHWQDVHQRGECMPSCQLSATLSWPTGWLDMCGPLPLLTDPGAVHRCAGCCRHSPRACVRGHVCLPGPPRWWVAPRSRSARQCLVLKAIAGLLVVIPPAAIILEQMAAAG
jgi:hypothetical protein